MELLQEQSVVLDRFYVPCLQGIVQSPPGQETSSLYEIRPRLF